MDSRNLHLVEHVTARLTVFIHPSYCQAVEKGIKNELDTHLLRYMEDQEAVLLAYSNIEVLTKQALLSNYFPYLTIECAADLVLFRPNPGEILVGRVHNLSAGMLGILVLGGVNASVAAGEMPEGFHFDPDHECWVQHGDYQRAIMLGDFVACKVLSAPVVDPESEELVFTLDASLLAEGEPVGLLDRQTQKQQQRRAALAAAALAEGIMQTTPGKQQVAVLPPTPGSAGKSSSKATSSAKKSSSKKHQRRDKARHRKEKKDKKRHKGAGKRKERDEQGAAAAEQPSSKRSKHNNGISSHKVEQPQQPPAAMANGIHHTPLQQPSAAATPEAAVAAAGTPATGSSSSKKKQKHKHKDKHKDKHRRSSSKKNKDGRSKSKG